MKKVVLALALFAFVGSSAIEAAPVSNEKEKTEKKEKKNKKAKKGKDCTPAEMKSCAPGGSAAAPAAKSCCASKAKAAATTETAPVPAQ